MSHNGSNYLIIAGTSGIGNALISLLQDAGAKLYVTSTTNEKLSSLAADYTNLCDATRFDEVMNIVEEANNVMGGLHGIAALPGSLMLKPAHQTSEAEFSETLQKNLYTAFAVTRAAGKVMKDGGSVVTMSSAVALEGLANHEAIAAAKGGVAALARSAAATYASQNIRFNCVAPGLTDTPMTKQLTSNETSLKVSAAMHALGKIGKPEQVASLIAWLLDPTNDAVTGQVVGVDNGLSSVRPKIKV
jgi:NAD(P)-dependent dehydrogenase (short-subunit alcohol dehydrogenase family)